MKIVYLIGRFPPVYGGQTPVEIDINSELVKRNHSICFITPRFDKKHLEFEQYNGISIIRISPPLKGPFSEILFVLNAFIKIKQLNLNPELIVDLIPFGNSMIITKLFSKIWKIPVVCKLSQEGTNEPFASEKGMFGFVRKRFFSIYEKIIAISPILVENCKMAKISNNKIEFIPNCVNTSQFTPVDEVYKNKLRQELFPNIQGDIVTIVGTITQRKRPHLAIEAWKILKLKYLKPATIVFVGPEKSSGQPFDEKYVNQLKNKIKQYGLEDSVIFTGFQKNIHEYYQASDITLFVSEREGLPGVVLQTMSAGVPIVTVNIEKITEYMLTNGKEGYITSENPKEISQRMTSLLLNSEQRDSMGNYSRKNALDRFSINAVTDKIEKLYQNAISLQ
ncbi:MAG: glycosyltransferase family 4 protein [Candidatus Marinimicrobia bacterium]|nr:glycosyltransferase family 4 protein [Candidatus Neomarinimicrobiota bacterium]MBL7109681.1 glycosyltransferase family 4 protein [Candidatus Neomarinimicrobiota bacterium]